VHAISATAREKVEKAGGTVSLLKEPKVKKQKHSKPKSKPAAAEPDAPEVEAEAEAPADDQAEQPASEEE
jgi:hypothetical protein